MQTLSGTQTRELSAIRPLVQRDRVAGHQVELIWRQGNVAIFSRSVPGQAPHEYEVVIVRIAPESVSPSGAVVPVREEYPGSSKWGRLGWSLPSREQAVAWAESVTANLGLPREERVAWPELLHRFR